jgi:hypothetical protein
MPSPVAYFRADLSAWILDPCAAQDREGKIIGAWKNKEEGEGVLKNAPAVGWSC